MREMIFQEFQSTKAFAYTTVVHIVYVLPFTLLSQPNERYERDENLNTFYIIITYFELT